MSALNWNLFIDTNEIASEAELVISFQEGNPQTFTKMVEQHTPKLLAIARRYLRCEDDCQDALQDAFLSAYKNMHQFHGQSQLSTWLHRIVINACLMKLRKQSRHSAIPLDDLLPNSLEETFEVTISAQDAPDHQLERDESRALLHRALQHLAPQYQEIIRLRDLEERTTEDVAVHLGITQGAVKTRLHRAHQALRTECDCIRGW